MFLDPTFWVATAFVAFIILIYILKVPTLLINTLDKRSNKIKNDLEQADKLCKDAQDLLADYQKKQRDAIKETELLIADAEKSAAQIVKSGQKKMAEIEVRREAIANARIKQAELAAAESVKIKTTEIVIIATRQILEDSLGNKTLNDTIEHSISDLSKSIR